MSAEDLPPSILSGPLEEVSRQLGTKTPLGSILNSTEWADVPAKIREEAFFSATVESVRALSGMQDGLMNLLEQTRRENGTLTTTRAKWISDMQSLTTRLGIRTQDPDKIGTLQDIGSERRLKLIRDMQVTRAQAKANHIAGQNRDALQAWPAQELIRETDAEEPRDWPARWSASGGQLVGGGRMVALKTDPIWIAISRFGVPYPPFDYGSGMGLRDIDREEAEALGLIAPDEILEPSLEREKEELTAGLKKEMENPLIRAALEDLFGSQIEIKADGQVVWKGSSLGSPISSQPLPNVPQPKAGRGVSADPDLPSSQEAAHINESVEVASVYSPEGALLETVLGTETGVEFDRVAVASGRYRDAIITHNHPAGNSFSDTDIAFASSANVRELRIVAKQSGGKSALFRMLRLGPDWLPPAVLRQAHATVSRSIERKQKAAIAKGTLTGRQARKQFAHEVMLELSKKTGIEYKKVDL